MDAVELQGVDAIGMTGQCMEALFPLRIPDLDHIVICTRNHQSAIVLNTTDCRHMANEDVLTFTSGDVPHSQSGVSRSRNNPKQS